MNLSKKLRKTNRFNFYLEELRTTVDGFQRYQAGEFLTAAKFFPCL